MPDLPNFFVVGSVKAGTTAFHHLLNQHPEIYMSPIKEPNFFAQSDLKPHLYVDQYRRSVSFNLDKYLRGSMRKTVHIADVKTWEDYRSLFKNVSAETAIGEGSNSYLFCPSSAGLIAQRFPDARIIMILRNPVDRAWSHYLMNRKLSYSVEEDFLGEFRKDTAANPKGWGITANYFELGLYANQLQRFLNFFPEKQIKVILYDDFRLAPQETLAATFEFLEVDTDHVPNTETQKNKAALPVWPKFYQFLFQTGLAHMIKHRIPASLREVMEKVIFSQSILPKLSASDRQYLIELYQSDISLLATILNRNLDHWLI